MRTVPAMPAPLTLNVSAARSFARRAVLLDQPAPDVATALEHHGYIQLDPLNVCGRMQDLILRNRVANYREGQLLEVIHGQSNGAQARAGFEHYIPGFGVLAAWPRNAYPYIRAHLERIHPTATRRPLTTEENVLAKKILAEIDERGPVMSDDLEHEGRAMTAWGTHGRLAKVVLEKLFAAGRLLITERRGFRRVYDLAARVMPPLKPADLPSDPELKRWQALLRLRQRRLVALPRAELPLVEDAVQPIQVEGGPLLYSLRGDSGLAESARENPEPGRSSCQLLAPLDPLIYDRKLTQRLWAFNFTWEVYTPAEIRKRGYYSLPALVGLELVGDIEPRMDRKRRRLVVISRRIRRGFSTAEAVSELGRFLGARGTAN